MTLKKIIVLENGEDLFVAEVAGEFTVLHTSPNVKVIID